MLGEKKLIAYDPSTANDSNRLERYEPLLYLIYANFESYRFTKKMYNKFFGHGDLAFWPEEGQNQIEALTKALPQYSDQNFKALTKSESKGMSINIVKPNSIPNHNRELCLEVDPSDTIETVKDLITCREGFFHYFIFCGFFANLQEYLRTSRGLFLLGSN